MNILTCCVLLLAIASVANSYIYNVTVSFSGNKRFDDTNGRLKLDFIGSGFEHKVVLSNKVERFRFGSIMNYVASCPYEINRILRVRLRFTLGSPYNPFYIMQSRYIYVHRVDIVPEYIMNYHQREMESKHFCATPNDAKISHKDTYVFVTACAWY